LPVEVEELCTTRAAIWSPDRTSRAEAAPGLATVITVNAREHRDPKMDRNQYSFSHANWMN
jgi:hypothetical protein